MDYRVFFAPPRDEDPNPADMEAVRAFLQTALEDRHVQVVSAVTEWQENFTRCNGWEGWKDDVATGFRYGTQEPRYHAIVVVGLRSGRATADIANAALSVKKPVLAWHDKNLYRVERLVQDEAAWKTGFRVELR
jgi:hypothetical protein